MQTEQQYVVVVRQWFRRKKHCGFRPGLHLAYTHQRKVE